MDHSFDDRGGPQTSLPSLPLGLCSGRPWLPPPSGPETTCGLLVVPRGDVLLVVSVLISGTTGVMSVSVSGDTSSTGSGRLCPVRGVVK